MIRGLVPWKPTPRPRRAASRRSYSGALLSRLTDDWVAPLVSANKAIEGNLLTLRARARSLVRNNPHAAAAVRLFQDNVTGPGGMTLQAEVAFRNGDLRRNVNDAIEAAWRAFQEPTQFSADGRLSGADFQRQVIGNLLVDGEVLIRRRRGFPNRYGFALEMLDPDQLDETFTRAAGEGTNEVRYGVEMDGYGRPVAYHLLESHPSDLTSRGKRRVRVDAADILHRYLPGRPGQIRGVTAFAPVLVRLHMLDGFEEAALVAARMAATNPIVFTQDKETYAAPEDGAAQEDVEIEMEPGVSRLLPPGIGAEMLSPEHPTTTFTEFDKAMLRAIAGGLGVAYTSLTQDLTDVNYSSIRAGLLAERDVWRGLQEWFACHILTPIYRDWLRHAQLANAVTLPTAEIPLWWAARFEGRGWSWVDPLNDVQAAELEIALGLNTRTALARERGRDYEAMARQLAEEQQIAREWGITVDGLKKTPKEAPDGSTGSGQSADDASDAAARAGRVRLVRRHG
jgi:lambda family phage portal protein